MHVRGAGVDLLKDAEISNPRLDKFDVHFPHALAMATEILPDRFDCIVVDEAQDFGEEYWLPIELLLRDIDRSTLFIFYDHNQAIYKRVTSFPIKDAPFILTRNCRNTRFIHEAGYTYYTGEPTEAPPIEGAPIEIINGASRESQARHLHSHILRVLNDEKIDPETVTVVVSSRSHKTFYSLIKNRPLPKPIRWAFEEVRPRNAILVDTMQRFKGLESPILYVWGADDIDCRNDKKLLYTTITRAKSRLFLVGDEAECRHIIEAVPSEG
jgi:superfamily I DNA/RNA helicase